jgi:hypothetical protein
VQKRNNHTEKKKRKEQTYNLKERDFWDNQNKMVQAGGGRYQEGMAGLA